MPINILAHKNNRVKETRVIASMQDTNRIFIYFQLREDSTFHFIINSDLFTCQQKQNIQEKTQMKKRRE